MASETDDRAAPATRPITGSGPMTNRSIAAGLAQNLGETAEMIAFKHTVFALPFALMSLITASGSGWPTARVLLWVIVAMVAARTAAMSFNRLADHRFDADNPRTADRSLPAGRLSRRFAWFVTIGSALVFVLAASRLNPLCLRLALPTLAVLLGYSYAKRFTSASHLWLGCALGIAPIGAWVAVTGSLDPPPLVLGAAVAFWVAGFDTIYSLQDEAFDRARGLRSLPSVMGAHRALWAARGFHLLAVVGFAVFAVAAGGGWIRLSAVAAAAVLMLWQHRLVRADDLSRVDAAFFSANGLLAVVMFVCFFAAKIVG
jgi:4-hydroxybenzoate polyprenyltransferase